MINRLSSFLRLASRSLIGKFLALALVFLIVPVILFSKFAEADAERQAFLLRVLQDQGHLIAQNLEPTLRRANGRSFLDIGKALQDLATDQILVKLLLRPAGQNNTFFLVAANPPLDAGKLDQEQQRLANTGILPRLDDSCDGNRALALRYEGSSGKEELLISMSPLHTANGCWLVLTSLSSDDLASTVLTRPFKQAPEVQLALAFYGLMALLICLTVAGAMFDLRAFARLARRIRQSGAVDKPSFAAIAAIPELLSVAREFDHMVATLDTAASALREAAEDNAHAFKAPIAAITQSMEPLKPLAHNDPHAQQAVMTIQQALHRLSSLVNAVRQLDEAAVEVMTAHLHRVDLALLAQQMVLSYDRIITPRAIRVVAQVETGIVVAATEESMETIIENLLDNAVSFSPPGGIVTLSVKMASGHVLLTVEDEGPGVPANQLEWIFHRNFSCRPAEGEDADHSGIGLAVVRRTVELLGGDVSARNRPNGGFCVSITLPRA